MNNQDLLEKIINFIDEETIEISKLKNYLKKEEIAKEKNFKI